MPTDEYELGDVTRSLDQLLFVDYLGNFDSLVLFFAGVSLVLKGRVTRFVLVAGSGIILGRAGMYVASLPLP